jgi:hypothetical protein
MQYVVIDWGNYIITYITDFCNGVSTEFFWLSIENSAVPARAKLSVCDTEIVKQFHRKFNSAAAECH